MKRIPISEATDEQIYSHLITVLGINPGPKGVVKRDTMEGKLRQADPEAKFVIVDEEPTPVPAEAPKGLAPAPDNSAEALDPVTDSAQAPSPEAAVDRTSLEYFLALAKQTKGVALAPEEQAEITREYRDSEVYEIMIDTIDEPGGDQPVWLSVNNRGQFVPRGVPARIRRPYFEVLTNAVRTVWDQDDNLNMIPRQVPSYPHRVLEKFKPGVLPSQTLLSLVSPTPGQAADQAA